MSGGLHQLSCAGGEVAARSAVGEGAGANTLTRLALLADLSPSVGEVY
jgi:hypothetical protein